MTTMHALEEKLGRLPTADEFAALIPLPSFDQRLAQRAVNTWNVTYTARAAGDPKARVYAMRRQITPEVVLYSVAAITEHIHRELIHRLRPLVGSSGVTWTIDVCVTSFNGSTYRVFICPECQETVVAADQGRWPILHPCAIEVEYAALDGLDDYLCTSPKTATMVPFITTVTT